MIAKIILYINTIRYLKAEQLINRVLRNLSPPKANFSPAPNHNTAPGDAFIFIEKQKSLLDENQFSFLNVEGQLTFSTGWNDPSYPKLWLYNLHYFEGLLNKDTAQELKNNFVNLWIRENPPGVGNGWEPYPLSLRIVNWIKWSLIENCLPDEAIKSLAVQVRYLLKTLEYHLLGNHLFANAKALIFAGLFFEGEEAEKWFRIGKKILYEQIPEQFLNDGGHFELSTTYHALLTEDLLDIIQLMQFCGKNVPNLWKDKANKAVNWLIVMTREDGLPPLFNDAAYGITPTLDQILSLYEVCNLEPIEELKGGLTDLPESGYFRFRNEHYSFFGDAGQIGPDYIAGHSHCDMLNFEMTVSGKPVIVDTGTSTYQVCDRRHLERSTKSHNTVQTGYNEQSEIWGAFRVARRAKIIKRKVSENLVIAKYMGYTKRDNHHERKFTFNDQSIYIEDTVSQSANAVARFHFHPEIFVEEDNGFIKAGPIELIFSGHTDIRIASYKYAPEFNKLVKAQVLEVTFSEYLKTEINI